MAEETTAGTAVIPTVSQKAAKLREHFQLRANQDESMATDNLDELADRQLAAIMDAETEDDIWNADQGGAIQMRDAVGLEAEIQSIRFALSDEGKSNRSGTYITCDATVLGGPEELLRKLGVRVGQETALQTGAELIVVKLVRMERADMFPVRIVIQGTETRAGNTVLRIGKAPVHTRQQ